MVQKKICDIETTQISGVEVHLPGNTNTYKETYFEWTPSTLVCDMNTNRIGGGILKAWHHVPTFNEVETHIDSEMFYFLSGTAIMLFVDIEDGKPKTNTVQIARIKEGTQIVIHAGKGHFVMVAEGADPVRVVVVSPVMDAPRIALPEAIMGI